MSYNTMNEITTRINELEARLEELENRENEIPDEIVDFFENDTDAFTPVAEALDSWNGFLGDDRCYSMAEFDDFFYGCTPSEIAQKIYHSDFNPYDDYFYFSIYGVESTDCPDYSDHIDEYAVDEIINNRSEVEYELPDEIVELLDELENIPDEMDEIADEIDELEAELDETETA